MFSSLPVFVLLFSNRVFATTNYFTRFSSQNMSASFQQAYTLSSFSSETLISCLSQCMKFCECGTVIYANNWCILFNAVPLKSQLTSASGHFFYMSKFSFQIKTFTIFNGKKQTIRALSLKINFIFNKFYKP